MAVINEVLRVLLTYHTRVSALFWDLCFSLSGYMSPGGIGVSWALGREAIQR